MYLIKEKRVLNNDVDLMVIEAPLVAKNAQAGHFIIIRVDEEGERIPLTIVEVNGDDVSIIYQKLGYSTTKLGLKNVGESVSDFVGPLGKPSHIRTDKERIIGVAGGVGAAPLYPQLKAYKALGKTVDLVIGARDKNHIILLEEYKSFCDNVYVCTDDGSNGKKGFVTDVLKELYETNTYDQAIAIGPLVMMKFTTLLNNQYNLQTDVSLNPIMIDGTGMCGNCRVTIHGKTLFACIDGPDFASDGIDFDELMIRQNYYKDEEHICNLRLKK